MGMGRAHRKRHRVLRADRTKKLGGTAKKGKNLEESSSHPLEGLWVAVRNTPVVQSRKVKTEKPE